MPKNIAQWTGFAVTMIIVLGRDADVLTAVPLGIAAGMLATLFQALVRIQLRPVRLFLAPRASRPPPARTAAVPGQFALPHRAPSMLRAVRSYRPGRRHT